MQRWLSPILPVVVRYRSRGKGISLLTFLIEACLDSRDVKGKRP